MDEHQKKEIERKIHRSACFQKVFKEADGEFVLNEIDKFTGYGDDVFHPDPYKNAYSAGQRSMAKFLHNIINEDVEVAKQRLEKETKNEK